METFSVINGECIIPEGTTEIHINDITDKDRSAIKRISIPASVKKIDDAAFNGCDLDTIRVDSNNFHFSSNNGCLIYVDEDETHLLHGCNSCSSIPEGVNIIECNAFNGCSSMKAISIPDTVRFIGYHAFDSCTSLQELSIPSSVTYVDSYAFRNCTSLKTVTLNTGIKEIDRGLFEGCSALEKITIPEGVKTILMKAFSGCESLASVRLPMTLDRLEIEEETFIGCNLDEIKIASDNGNYVMKGNCLLNMDNSRLIRGCNSSKIPNTVKEICDNAFSGCTRLEAIVIPDCVERIGRGAFKGCTSLKRIIIPDSVEEICSYAFSGCVSLQDITIGNSTSFDSSTSFRGCPCAKENGLDNGLIDIIKEVEKRC